MQIIRAKSAGSLDLTHLPYYSRLFILGNILFAREELDDALGMHLMVYNMRKEYRASAFHLAASLHKIGDIQARLERLDDAS